MGWKREVYKIIIIPSRPTSSFKYSNLLRSYIKNKENKTLTAAFGIPVGDDQNSQTAAERGPIFMQDVHLYKIIT